VVGLRAGAVKACDCLWYRCSSVAVLLWFVLLLMSDA
jgi:hypothetical protein